jgi:hypothetical protein
VIVTRRRAGSDPLGESDLAEAIMRIIRTAILALPVMGCATGQAGTTAPVPRAELVATEATYLYDALRDARSDWLRRTVDAPEMGVARRRGGPPPSQDAIDCTAMAYVGSQRVRAEDLRRILVAQVREVRLIPPRAPRPDGSRCTHDRPAIHVVLSAGG